jgi:hypothetical protein
MPAGITVPISQTAGDTFAGAPRCPWFYRSPAEDMHDLLDLLDAFEKTMPGLAGRLDHDSVAIAGHSRLRRRKATHIRVHTPGAVLRAEAATQRKCSSGGSTPVPRPARPASGP